MQGTIVMMMALSGLGCHHKGAEVAYAPTTCYSSYDSCYSSSCYASSCYGSLPTCYSSGVAYETCYSSCYSSCYGSCYSGGHHAKAKGCGLFGGLFSCFKKNRGCYSSCYSTVDYGCYSSCYSSVDYSSCYSSCYSSYAGAPVYGSYTPVYGGPISGATYVDSAYPSYQGAATLAPAEAATPVPPAPAPPATSTAPKPPTPDETVTPRESTLPNGLDSVIPSIPDPTKP